MAISFVRGTSDRVVVGATSKTTAALASAATTGQLLLFLARIQDGEAGRVVTPPTGFTALFTHEENGGTLYGAYKVAGGSEGTTYSYSWTNTSFVQADIISIWDGVDTTTPMDATATAGDAGFTDNHNLRALSTVTNNAVAIGVSAGQGLSPWGAPAGWTEEFDVADFQVIDKLFATAGSIGTANVTHAFGWTATATIALRPSGAAAATSMAQVSQRTPMAILAR